MKWHNSMINSCLGQVLGYVQPFTKWRPFWLQIAAFLPQIKFLQNELYSYFLQKDCTRWILILMSYVFEVLHGRNMIQNCIDGSQPRYLISGQICGSEQYSVGTVECPNWEPIVRETSLWFAPTDSWLPVKNCWALVFFNMCFYMGLILECSAARSEEHTSELQSRETISYAVFCLKKKKT